MRKILVATDFSTRSDRAIRRACLLVRQFAADLAFVHVVDEDQNPRLLAAEEREATTLLQELAQTLRERDGLQCSVQVIRGTPSAGILKAAHELAVDLIVIGPHRRQPLSDVFVGTTAERTIRQAQCPVLMVNGFPTTTYRHILLPVDFSDNAAEAARQLKSLRLADGLPITVMHAFDAPSTELIVSSGATLERAAAALEAEQRQATAKLDTFLAEVDLTAVKRVLKPVKSFPAGIITDCAKQEDVDLIVLGTRGHGGLKKMLLGSVAAEVLRISEQDVLMVPPPATD